MLRRRKRWAFERWRGRKLWVSHEWCQRLCQHRTNFTLGPATVKSRHLSRRGWGCCTSQHQPRHSLVSMWGFPTPMTPAAMILEAFFWFCLVYRVFYLRTKPHGSTNANVLKRFKTTTYSFLLTRRRKYTCASLTERYSEWMYRPYSLAPAYCVVSPMAYFLNVWMYPSTKPNALNIEVLYNI